VFPPDTAKEWFYSAELEKTYEEKREEGGGPYWQNNGKLALLMNSTAKMIFEAFSQSRTTLEDMHVDRPLAKACAYNALFGATVKNETAEKTDTSLRRQIIAAANHIAQHPSVKDQPQQLLTLMYATGCDLTLTDSIPESTAVPTEQTAATQAANPMAQFVQAMMSAASSVAPNPTTTTATGPTYTRKTAQQHVLPRPQPTRQVQTQVTHQYNTTEPSVQSTTPKLTLQERKNKLVKERFQTQQFQIAYKLKGDNHMMLDLAESLKKYKILTMRQVNKYLVTTRGANSPEQLLKHMEEKLMESDDAFQTMVNMHEASQYFDSIPDIVRLLGDIVNEANALQDDESVVVAPTARRRRKLNPEAINDQRQAVILAEYEKLQPKLAAAFDVGNRKVDWARMLNKRKLITGEISKYYSQDSHFLVKQVYFCIYCNHETALAGLTALIEVLEGDDAYVPEYGDDDKDNPISPIIDELTSIKQRVENIS
ncbi:hypothetical protein D5018_21040, partial [Parashewanella curva]